MYIKSIAPLQFEEKVNITRTFCSRSMNIYTNMHMLFNWNLRIHRILSFIIIMFNLTLGYFSFSLTNIHILFIEEQITKWSTPITCAVCIASSKSGKNLEGRKNRHSATHGLKSMSSAYLFYKSR